MAPLPAPKKPHSADATMEYRGPIVEVEDLADVSVELVPDDSVVQRARAESLAPIALTEKPPAPANKPDADASLFDFPHPVDPALFADTTAELRARDLPELPELPDLDDDLPPAPNADARRWRFVAFAGVMVFAGLLVGLAIGSHSSRVTAAENAENTASKSIESKKVALPDPASVTTTTTTKSTSTTAATSAPTVDAPTTGTIVSPKWASKRRVFMDGKEVGKSGALDVKCGQHVVRIGVVGKDRKVNVPCGGKVNVLP